MDTGASIALVLNTLVWMGVLRPEWSEMTDSPSHSTKSHVLRSRSIHRRQSALANSSIMNEMRSTFAHMASQRRATYPDNSSLVDRLLVPHAMSRKVSAGYWMLPWEALEPWARFTNREALVRSRNDHERVELLLKQVLGHTSIINSSSFYWTNRIRSRECHPYHSFKQIVLFTWYILPSGTTYIPHIIGRAAKQGHATNRITLRQHNGMSLVVARCAAMIYIVVRRFRNRS